MKIGILTYHRAHNYGAVLQCYALQETLKKLGADVSIINYKQPHIERAYKPKYSIKHIIKLLLLIRITDLKQYLSTIKNLFLRKYHFNKFRKKYLNCTKECKNNNIPQDFDRYIIGSDQVWSIHCTRNFDNVFWGSFKRKPTSKLYGYAISCNGDFHNFIDTKTVCHYFNLFDDITFREEKAQKEIEKTTGISKNLSLDPTLLSDEEIWSPFLKSKWEHRKFVVVYQIRRSKASPMMLENKAQEYAKKHHLEVVNLTGMFYSIEDFVSLIKNAHCVFTSSYHATIFSIIFNRPFYSFLLYDNHDERYKSLLFKLNLSDHLADQNTETSDHTPYITNIDDAKRNLNDLRADSILYLKKIIS